MEDKIEIGKKKTRKAKSEPKFHKNYPYELRLKAVKLHLEDGIEQQVVARELGVGKASLGNWVRSYRTQGEAGLRDKPNGRKGWKKKLPEPVTAKILEIKKQEPSWGVKRIAQILKRVFFLPGSPETVRNRLTEAGMMNNERAKGRRNMTRPRFFERATPNQLWQTDIFTFRLGGRYAYLIAFMDDYSRYVVGADLFRSPTAAAVIEVYRVAVGEYQPPKEMLTDNGRQYTTWRGTSRFEAELQKDRVIHIKSRPQHPMTLGKVERFWSTIWQEFLARAPFDSFEAARERIRLWIKYYNHKRPHQGIGGMCPADRYFEVANELRKTIAAGVTDNVLEMALRGMPRAPFYMVGRMEGQSVVLRAEKGKLKLSVGEEGKTQQELTYDLQKGKNDGESDGKEGQNRNGQEQKENPVTEPICEHQCECGGESAGGAGGVDGTDEARGGMPAVGSELDHVPAVAGSGDGGNVAGTGESGESGWGSGAESAVAGAHHQEANGLGSEQARIEAGEVVSESGNLLAQTRGGDGINENGEGSTSSQRDHAGTEGANNGHGGGETARSIAQDLLRVGEAWPDGALGGTPGGGTRETEQPDRSGEGGTQAAGGPVGEGAQQGEGSGGSPAGVAGHCPDRSTQGAE
jgi:transposase InsO family protein